MNRTKEVRHRSSGKSGKQFMVFYENKTRSNSLSCYEQLRSQGRSGHKPSVTPIVRAILFDWLSQVSEQFHFTHNTTYLTFSIIDRFISKQPVAKQRLQLIGVAALYVAHKLQETTPIKLKSFADVTANAFSQDEIQQTESAILVLLKWKLSIRTLGYYLDQAIYFWDDFANGTTAARVQFRNESNIQNYRLLRRWCDYIMLYVEVNDMDRQKVALALLYTFLKNHQSFKNQPDQQVAALFGVTKKVNSKLISEVFSIFLKQRYQMKLAILKKQINFIIYRLCLESPIWKKLVEPQELNIKPQSNHCYNPQNLELFKLMGRQFDN